MRAVTTELVAAVVIVVGALAVGIFGGFGPLFAYGVVIPAGVVLLPHLRRRRR